MAISDTASILIALTVFTLERQDRRGREPAPPRRTASVISRLSTNVSREDEETKVYLLITKLS